VVQVTSGPVITESIGSTVLVFGESSPVVLVFGESSPVVKGNRSMKQDPRSGMYIHSNSMNAK
jgi:hypothetical protein